MRHVEVVVRLDTVLVHTQHHELHADPLEIGR
jgi:hypothetical protein